MRQAATHSASAGSVPQPPIHTRGLRQKLMQLSLTLTAIGLALLVISLATVWWLRTNTNHLALQRTPAVVATQRAQIGLQRSLAGLRGWGPAR